MSFLSLEKKGGRVINVDQLSGAEFARRFRCHKINVALGLSKRLYFVMESVRNGWSFVFTAIGIRVFLKCTCTKRHLLLFKICMGIVTK